MKLLERIYNLEKAFLKLNLICAYKVTKSPQITFSSFSHNFHSTPQLKLQLLRWMQCIIILVHDTTIFWGEPSYSFVMRERNTYLLSYLSIEWQLRHNIQIASSGFKNLSLAFYSALEIFYCNLIGKFSLIITQSFYFAFLLQRTKLVLLILFLLLYLPLLVNLLAFI